jgi:hypothetical protein
MDNVSRETLGQVVRTAWVKWAQRQPDPKPGWLVPWDELSEADKDADRSIGAAVYALVSRETSGEQSEPLLFWRICAEDASMVAKDKIAWLVASYEHCQMLAGLSMPAELLDRRIGVAAIMARISDVLLPMQGNDTETDSFIVKWLCFACDQLWDWVPKDRRTAPDITDPDNSVYNAWIGEINRRIPGLVAAGKGASDFRSRAGGEEGDRMVLVCPACQWQHAPDTAICSNCAAPLRHIQPVPYSTARRLDP